MDNVTVLPLIATRGVIVFPNQTIVIEVGRPQSLAALKKAQSDFDGNVFLVCQKDINVVDPAIEDLYETGTICRIKAVHDKGSFARVSFVGQQRANLQSFELNNGTLLATCQIKENLYGDQVKMMALSNKIVSSFDKPGINRKFTNEILSKLTSGLTSAELADQFGQYYPMSIAKKQELLSMDDLNDRLMQCVVILEADKEMVEMEAKLNAKVKENIDASQKEYFLREKLRAIKEELGDVSNVSDDSENIRAQIEKGNYPAHIKQRALDELAHFEMLPMGSQEGSVIRSYLDWLLNVPWWQTTTDNADINEIEARLDADHYGLKKVKERILEYIAVKQMTNSLNAPILCLVGPPGVGKTSLAKSVAHALDRKFVKMSVGGVKDEAEIRGHRRTYLGSMPGRIIQSMKKAGVVNPVFLIDEIDKLGYDYKGDPSSAMLEVLDPEQNTAFSDHYLEEPYDLSKVLFIATANYLENIPEPLKDRLEIIELSSYTEVDKCHIAHNHLITKEMKVNGLKSSQFKLSDDMVTYLIRYYTREAGVRQLERTIGTLARKSVLEILKGNKKSVTITKKLINQWLGKEIFDYGKKEKKDQIGVVTGLAYTQFGGDILSIEVTTYEGSGKLVVTGQLGDVMKESTQIALGYVKSHAKQYGIDSQWFEKHDIQIHVPEGAVPKDGPSAGVTMTTALISALTGKPVDSNIAMTGEITLRGNVLPIGGLKEKSMAAHRCGILRIFIPKENVKDIEDIPTEVKKDMTFVPCVTIQDVLKEALV